MRIDEATTHPPCGNPTCNAKLTVKLVDIRAGAEVKCEECGAVNVIQPQADGSDPAGALTSLQRELDALAGKKPPVDDDD